MITMNTESVAIRSRLKQYLEDALIVGSLCNRNYQGVINSLGDNVYCGVTCDDVTIKDYDPAVAMDASQEIGGEDITLVIDHGAYFNIKIDDEMHAREDILTAATKSAAAELAKNADQYILDVIREGAGKKVTTAVPDDGLYMLLMQVKMAMDNAGVPRSDRKLILPPYLETGLLLKEQFVTNASGNAPLLSENSVAHVAGFDVYVSNDLEDEIIAMSPDAVTFANEIPRVTVDGDTVVGLCLSGAKVTIPNRVVVFSITG